MADGCAKSERLHVRSGASDDHHGGDGIEGNEEISGISERSGRWYILSGRFYSQRVRDQLCTVLRFPRSQGESRVIYYCMFSLSVEN